MTQIKVCFTYDINGILEVEVTDRNQKKTIKKVLTSEQIRLSEKELEKRLAELKRYKLTSSGGVRAKLLLARGERMFAQLLGEQRQEVAQIMQWLQERLDKQNDQEIVNSLKEAEAALDRLDGNKR